MASDPFSFNAATSTSSEDAFNLNIASTQPTQGPYSFGTVATSRTGPLVFSSAIKTDSSESPFQFDPTSSPYSTPYLSDDDSPITTGGAIGVGFGVLIFLILVSLGTWLLLRRRRSIVRRRIHASRDRFIERCGQNAAAEMSRSQTIHESTPAQKVAAGIVDEEKAKPGRGQVRHSLPPTYEQVMREQRK